MKKDVNNTKEFYEWIEKNFNWVDSAVKRLMFRAWCARNKKKK